MIDGGSGEDFLNGPAASFNGGSGHDTISYVAGPNAPTINAGFSGNVTNDTDTLIVFGTSASDQIDVAHGANELNMNVGGFTIAADGIQKLRLDGGAGADTFIIETTAIPNPSFVGVGA